MHRVIPVLSLIDGDLVKTRNFKTPRYIGDPINALSIFNAKEVDELVLHDIRASQKFCQPNFCLIKDIVSEAFMPVGYGGGIRSMEDIDKLFKIGVEKVTINTSALTNSELIKQASEHYGSQSIVVSLDIKKKRFLGGYKIVSPSVSRGATYELIETIRKFEEFGAGEVIVNSVDNDGTMRGVDTDLIKICSDNLTIPLVYVGGVGSDQHIMDSMQAGSSATGVGSYFVYRGPRKAVLITYRNPTTTLVRGLD